jgi:hypothetical protein
MSPYRLDMPGSLLEVAEIAEQLRMGSRRRHDSFRLWMSSDLRLSARLFRVTYALTTLTMTIG